MQLTKLKKITPISQCKICFSDLRENNIHEFLFKDINICPRCLEELDPKIKEIKINNIKGIYLYLYNDKIREKIYTLKGCGDIELATTFINYFLFELKLKYKDYIIVPSPSDENSNNIRGFNHVEEIFKPLKLNMIKCLYKTKEFKQADLSRKEREKVSNFIAIKDSHLLRNKKVLFVDDIFTTGSTLKACLNLIKKSHPKKLNFLVIAKVIDKKIS